MSSKEILKTYSWLFLILIGVIFLVLESIGLQQYGTEIYNMQKNQKAPEISDMVVVLAGSGGRIEAAYDLMKVKYIPILFIAGANNKITFEQLSKTYRWDNSSKDKIRIDNVSTSTWENAKITSEFALKNNIKNIVLVTSMYHMQRAEFLFKKVFKNSNIQIIPFATYVQPIEMNGWWHDFKVLRNILEEYFKFQYYRLIFSGK